LKRIILAFFLISLTLLSCASNNDNIENRKWYLLEIEGDNEIAVLNDKEPYIEFDLESQKIGGNASCNNFFTDYFIDGDSIHFGLVATTMMACSDDTNQEYRFLQALARIESFKLEEEKLYLYESDKPILIFSSFKK
jgi:heat shock protein HslJ